MRSGFTLVEIVLVAAIIAVVATFGMINLLGQRENQRLQNAAEILVRKIQLTMERSRSQEDGRQWWMVFSNPTGENNDLYYICYGSNPPTGSGTDCISEGGSEFERISLGAGLEFADPASGTAKNAVFAKASGLPLVSFVVTINSTTGSGSKTITVSEEGRVDF